jgi:hypothetical protein
MKQSEIDEIVGELYAVPPARFVGVRESLARTAREAGNRELADQLRRLRRPTQSAWLVNVLAREERPAMEGLFALGRELREAQTRLDGAKLRHLSVRRQHVINDLLERARRRATEAGVKPTEAHLAEVAETLRAALVDLAASSTVLAGRLVRPMSHSGFGPQPHIDAPPAVAQPIPVTNTNDQGEWSFWPVEHAVAAQQPSEAASVRPRVVAHRERPREDQIRRAEADLAAAEESQRQRERELSAAEDAAQVARDRLRWIEDQRTAAQSEKAAADRRLEDAQAARQTASAAVAAAKRALQAAREA